VKRIDYNGGVTSTRKVTCGAYIYKMIMNDTMIKSERVIMTESDDDVR